MRRFAGALFAAGAAWSDPAAAQRPQEDTVRVERLPLDHGV
ncbi:hypothetical protein [Sphingomonas sp. RS2018]